ncbi:MAG: hypothetical protein H6589_07250 [Flavobacteriales bacterium]|nr:hypothetical protein [Flavobacteriales bacterium]
MATHRITKYNPANRNSLGHYLIDSEWTSISDIGKPEYNLPTFEEYYLTENSYCQAVKAILDLNNVVELEVVSLEANLSKSEFTELEVKGYLKNMNISLDYINKTFKNGIKLNWSDIEVAIRLILREIIWCELKSPIVSLNFGYDYYMYVDSKLLDTKTIEKISEMKMFID